VLRTGLVTAAQTRAGLWHGIASCSTGLEAHFWKHSVQAGKVVVVVVVLGKKNLKPLSNTGEAGGPQKKPSRRSLPRHVLVVKHLT
jgi:hypothetical protein